MNDDQAVGVNAGIVERSAPNVPSRERRAIVGSFPSARESLDERVVRAVEGEREDAPDRPKTER